MKIAVLPGDGVGTEVISQAIKVLHAVSSKYDIDFEFNEGKMGGSAIDEFGDPFPEETIKICKESDAILLGAVGGPKWDNVSPEMRPEKGLLKLRKTMGAFANLRPAVLFKELSSASNLKNKILKDGIDIMIVRELTGGAYFGKKGTLEIENGEKAYDVTEYSTFEIERIAKVAFEIAGERYSRVTLVDKSNVLQTSKLWRKTVTNISKEYKNIDLNYMYVDNAAMQLIRNPGQFDVILTENMFGDILSDEASMITGSLGMLPSASIGSGNIGIYEPVHGSAPDIAGKDRVNPIAAIMSAALMLKYNFKMSEAAKDIENAVLKVIEKGYRTLDIMEEGKSPVGTDKMGDLILTEI
ncbi:3-isopropylmalate dehydrogenase [Clostridium fermenticellae]|uniref:3-isopropylmalate dehydrogenase n=1 Tax=Clostridium fermenticellae TaxID=2068654 RepID=A0A386H392_9CLOT|nr:3-isopropylmalate dehydrogenase [Clostridium fermenticellae]AYD40150.1 3-isopropylmalate dehydrogenase [Clostridium fermenticellae]